MLAGLLAASIFLGCVPVGDWLVVQLEQRFPRPEPLPQHIDGVVLLGGEINPQQTIALGQPVLGRGARLIAFAELARRYPEARLIFSGGSGQLFDRATTEAEAMPIAFRAVGLDPTRVEYDGKSRNTYENAVFSRRIANPKVGEVWIVVTSAAHMPRAIGVFRKAAFPVVPYPVGFRGDPQFNFSFTFGEGFESLNQPLKEFVGLAAYRVLGYTDALFPAP